MKVLKLKQVGEKLDKEKVISTGGNACCFGGPDDECDCTASGGARFLPKSELWLIKMEIIAVP